MRHIGLVPLRCILTKPPAGGDAGATAAMQLTCREPHARGPGTQFTGFTGAKVQILTHAPQCLAAHLNAEIAAGNIAKVLVFAAFSRRRP